MSVLYDLCLIIVFVQYNCLVTKQNLYGISFILMSVNGGNAQNLIIICNRTEMTHLLDECTQNQLEKLRGKKCPHTQAVSTGLLSDLVESSLFNEAKPKKMLQRSPGDPQNRKHQQLCRFPSQLKEVCCEYILLKHHSFLPTVKEFQSEIGR